VKRLILCLFLLAAACGPAQAQQPASPPAAIPTPSPETPAASSPSPDTSASPGVKPSPSGPVLFAVLEAKIPGNQLTWNTVAITGLDGRARARTTFTPMPVPAVECAAATLPPSAHVVGGKVYFADGAGVVRSLAADGQVARVAAFPFNGHQQMLSFAVSPDGGQVIGMVFTLPAKPATWCGTQEPSGYSLDVYSAKAGGSGVLLYHQGLSGTANVTALFGWDAIGPFGTSPTGWASQGGGPAPYGRGTLVRIDPSTGRVLGKIGSSTCGVWAMTQGGDYACTAAPAVNASGTYDGEVNVDRADGSRLWQVNLTTDDGFVYGPDLAPDEAHVAVGVNGAVAVVGRAGGQVKIGFYPVGWVDSNTMLGTLIDPLNPDPNLAYATLSDPSTIVSLGFPGLFVGTLSP
jgi:hypothetical protein